MANTNVTIRMDSELKKRADELFSEMGINFSTAINMFVRQTLREQGIPFQIQVREPNRSTIEAMIEAEKIALDPTVPRYSSAAELFKALDLEED